MIARALHATLTADGQIRLTLDELDLGAPGPGEVIVRIDATPVNQTDLALMLRRCARMATGEKYLIVPE